MESEISQLWTVMLWSIGGVSALSTTGFFYLLGEFRKMQKTIEQALTMASSIKKIADSVQKIETAIIGDLMNDGLLTEHRDVKKRVSILEEKFKD